MLDVLLYQNLERASTWFLAKIFILKIFGTGFFGVGAARPQISYWCTAARRELFSDFPTTFLTIL